MSRHSNCVATLSPFFCVLGIIMMLSRHYTNDFALKMNLDCRDLPFQSCVVKVCLDITLMMYSFRPLEGMSRHCELLIGLHGCCDIPY